MLQDGQYRADGGVSRVFPVRHTCEVKGLTFSTILLDPPWPEKGGGKIKRGADKHFKVINKKWQMLETIVRAEPWGELGPDLHCWMWMTDNYTSWGRGILEFLGFKIHRSFPWVKGRMGIGQYARGCHENLWFATRGRGMTIKHPGTFRTDHLVGAPSPVDSKGRVIYSAKPERAHELIEAMSKGPYLEMFARNPRDGWTVWGNEV